MIEVVEDELRAKDAPVPLSADDVGHAVRVFCGNEPDVHAVQNIRAAFVRANAQGLLRHFVDNCSALCGRRLKGAQRAQAVLALGALPALQWPFVASSVHGALDPAMRAVDVADLVRAVAKLLPTR